MKIPLYNREGKTFSIEEGPPSIQVIDEDDKIRSTTNYFKLFKWFVAINILILLLFSGYALWNLYKLESVMQAKEEAINLNRYFDRYDVNSLRKPTAAEDAKVSDIDRKIFVSDLHEWRQSILDSLENLQDDVSYNLKFLLHTIMNTIKNFVESDLARTKNSESIPENTVNSTNSSSATRSKVIKTNLTDFEIHILKEFINLNVLGKKGRTQRSRFARADNEDSYIDDECNIEFMLDVKDDKLMCLSIKPAAAAAAAAASRVPIKINNDMSNLEKNEVYKGYRECIFNITAKPFGST